MKKRQIVFVFLSILAVFFIVIINSHVSFAAGPAIVQFCDGQLVAGQVRSVGCTLNGVTAGDTLVIGTTGALRSGSDGGISIVAGSDSCATHWHNLVVDSTGGTGGGAGAVSIFVCLSTNISGGTYDENTSWTSGSCTGSVPCGFMTIWMYELQGGGFTFTNSSGTNGNTVGNIGSTNTITYSTPALLLGFSALNTAFSTQSAGSGFSLTATCLTSGINSAQPGCAEQQTDSGVGSTNFQFDYSQANNAWTVEGVSISGGAPVIITTTVTAWNVPDTNGLNAGTLFLVFLLVPTFLLAAIPIRSKHRESYVTFILLGLIFSSLLGGLVAGIPLALTAVFVGIFVIYLWKGKPKGGTVT